MKTRYFRYPADRFPVFLFLMLSVLDFTLYFMVDNWWLLIPYFLLMLPVKGAVSAFNHHHQHLQTFRHPMLNNILEFFYFLHTGAGANMWKLQHNLGHHQHYQEPLKDEARWKTDNGRTMGHWEYTLTNTLQIYRDILRIGKRHPKLLKTALIHQAFGVLLLGVMTYYQPFHTILLFLLPMLVIFIATVYVTYDHHAELEMETPFHSSRNNLNKWQNLIHGNLGYHTAHHIRPGLHWSKLPEFHESIKHKIPESLVSYSYFTWRSQS